MPTVALQATPADLEILAGEWAGEYESAALGRRGSIEFKLKAGTDEAYGDVLMVPRGRRTPYQLQPYHDAQQSPPGMPSSELLTIRFIRASNGSISVVKACRRIVRAHDGQMKIEIGAFRVKSPEPPMPFNMLGGEEPVDPKLKGQYLDEFMAAALSQRIGGASSAAVEKDAARRGA